MVWVTAFVWPLFSPVYPCFPLFLVSSKNILIRDRLFYRLSCLIVGRLTPFTPVCPSRFGLRCMFDPCLLLFTPVYPCFPLFLASSENIAIRDKLFYRLACLIVGRLSPFTPVCPSWFGLCCLFVPCLPLFAPVYPCFWSAFNMSAFRFHYGLG